MTPLPPLPFHPIDDEWMDCEARVIERWANEYAQQAAKAARAEAEALLTFVRPYVYGLENIERIDAYLAGGKT